MKRNQDSLVYCRPNMTSPYHHSEFDSDHLEQSTQHRLLLTVGGTHDSFQQRCWRDQNLIIEEVNILQQKQG